LTLESCRARVNFSIGRKTGSKPGSVASSIYSALVPELKFKPENAETKLDLDGDTVIFEITTDSLPDLRANINSYLRLASASYRCLAGG
jgi:tRNA threonylcarbamoyladenosine modification (KEOPS) complex  Pcc1 subunit